MTFPPDRGLEVRMAIAIVVQAAIVLAYVAAFAYVWVTVEDVGVGLVFLALCFFVIGLGAAKSAGVFRHAAAAQRPRVEGIAVRLSAVAGIAPPEIHVRQLRTPLSWTTAVPFRGRRLFVTTGLLEAVDDAVLEAVVAHELGHLINRDAVVMTALVGPPVAMLRGIAEMWSKRGDKFRGRLTVLCYGWLVAPFGLIGTLTGRIVSRHRELAADRAAAVLTGSPARVQAALLAVSGDLERLPERDLRAVAAGDVFHFVPARPARGVRRLWATHPTTERRLAHLARLEERLHA